MDPNHELQDGLLRVLGFLAVSHAAPPLQLPKLVSISVHPDGDAVISCGNRVEVDQVADALGLDKPPRLTLYNEWGTYTVSDHGWIITCNERPPYEPIPGDLETARNTAGGA